MRVRLLLIRVALWMVMAGLLFAASEAALAFYSPFDLVVRGDRIVLPVNRRVVFDQDAEDRRFRSSEWIAGKLDRVIVHSKNSLGFRGPEPPAAFDRQLTIVTVGGSTTECFYLSDGKTWPERLAAALDGPLAPVWVNNAGLDGHSTFGHTVLMEDHLIPLRPKVVLFLIGINDVHADQPLEADRRVQSALDLSSPKRLLVSAANNSQVFALGLNLYRNARAAMFGLNYNSEFDLRTAAHRAPSDGAIQAARREHAERLHAFRQRVARLVSMSRGAGIEPVLMTQPALYGRGHDDETGTNLETIAVGALDGRTAWATLELFNEVTRDVGREQGVFVVDLAHMLEKSSQYFYDYFHYTNEGAARIAELLYTSLCPELARRFPEYVQAPCGPPPAAAGGDVPPAVPETASFRSRS
jgi:lysophospholipase L1-like esterase